MSEQLARRTGLGVGDRLALPAPGGAWDVAVAGVYPDYGNPEGQVMVAVDALAARWPEADKRRFALRVDPAAAPALIVALRAAFELERRPGHRPGGAEGVLDRGSSSAPSR